MASVIDLRWHRQKTWKKKSKKNILMIGNIDVTSYFISFALVFWLLLSAQLLHTGGYSNIAKIIKILKVLSNKTAGVVRFVKRTHTHTCIGHWSDKDSIWSWRKRERKGYDTTVGGLTQRRIMTTPKSNKIIYFYYRLIKCAVSLYKWNEHWALSTISIWTNETFLFKERRKLKTHWPKMNDCLMRKKTIIIHDN